MERNTPQCHTLLDDIQGLALGVFMSALGVHFLTHATLLTGQTAGIAAMISYVTAWSFGPVFFVVNLPFYILGYLRLGWVFTVKSLICVTALSALTEVIPLVLVIDHIAPWMAALVSGALVGMGVLAAFRHNGSLGGFGILALLIQDQFGFRAGYVQLAADAVIFGIGFLLFPAPIVLWSLVGAVIMNLIIAVNHRRDRYIAT